MKATFVNAVVTGACGGLGRALAQVLIAQGSAVALAGLNREVLEGLRAQAPERCRIYTPDVSDSVGMQALAADWMAAHGAPDLVIANAGVAGGYATAEAADLAMFRRLLEINLIGVPTTFQPFMKSLKPGAALVGVASIAGWRGMPGNGAYCASKAGLIAYLQSLRTELREQGVQVSTVCPGYLRTPLTASNNFLMPGLMEPEAAAEQLLRRVAAGHEWIVLPRRTGWLSRLLGLLPEKTHDRILLSQPRKPRAGEAGSTPIPGLHE